MYRQQRREQMSRLLNSFGFCVPIFIHIDCCSLHLECSGLPGCHLGSQLPDHVASKMRCTYSGRDRAGKSACQRINKQNSLIISFSQNQQFSGVLKGKQKNCKQYLICHPLTEQTLRKVSLPARSIMKSDLTPFVGRTGLDNTNFCSSENSGLCWVQELPKNIPLPPSPHHQHHGKHLELPARGAGSRLERASRINYREGLTL